LKTITIIDTFGFFFRSYYALPPLRNSEGFPTGLLTGFINLIDSLRRDHATDYLVFALDSKGPTFREKIYPEYKANREAPPEDLMKQLPIAIDWIEEMGFANLSREGYEADDVICTVSKFARKQKIRVRIVSHDKDLYQLIDDANVVLVDTVKKREVDEEACREKFGVLPRDFTDFQAIVGDASDNVPGVKGIGKVGAAKLINKYHTLENIYADIENCGTANIQKKLLESKEAAFLSRELVTMNQNVFKDFDLESFVFEDKNYLSCLLDDFERFEMKKAIEKAKVGVDCSEMEEEEEEKPDAFEAICLDTKEKLFEVINSINKNTLVAFDTETTGLDTKKDKMVGFSFAMSSEKAYYVPIAHSYLGVTDQVRIDDAIEAIKVILNAKVIGQNLKFDLKVIGIG